MYDNSVSELSVFFDGGCPICRIEVDLYNRIDVAKRIYWIDIELLDEQSLPEDKTRSDLLGRFHALDREGWHIGVDAFARIWKVLPGLGLIWWIFKLPIIRQAAELAYRGFLRWQQRDRQRRLQKIRVIESGQ